MGSVDVCSSTFPPPTNHPTLLENKEATAHGHLAATHALCVAQGTRGHRPSQECSIENSPDRNSTVVQNCYPWQMGQVEAIMVPWDKHQLPIWDIQREELGGGVKPFPLTYQSCRPCTLASDQSESLASDESDTLKPWFLELRTLALILPELKLYARIPCAKWCHDGNPSRRVWRNRSCTNCTWGAGLQRQVWANLNFLLPAYREFRNLKVNLNLNSSALKRLVCRGLVAGLPARNSLEQKVPVEHAEHLWNFCAAPFFL